MPVACDASEIERLVAGAAASPVRSLMCSLATFAPVCVPHTRAAGGVASARRRLVRFQQAMAPAADTLAQIGAYGRALRAPRAGWRAPPGVPVASEVALGAELCANAGSASGSGPSSGVQRLVVLALPDFLNAELWARHEYSLEDVRRTLDAFPARLLWQMVLAFNRPAPGTSSRPCSDADVGLTYGTSRAAAVQKLVQLVRERFPAWESRPSVTWNMALADDPNADGRGALAAAERHSPAIPVHRIGAAALAELVSGVSGVSGILDSSASDVAGCNLSEPDTAMPALASPVSSSEDDDMRVASWTAPASPASPASPTSPRSPMLPASPASPAPASPLQFPTLQSAGCEPHSPSLDSASPPALGGDADAHLVRDFARAAASAAAARVASDDSAHASGSATATSVEVRRARRVFSWRGITIAPMQVNAAHTQVLVARVVPWASHERGNGSATALADLPEMLLVPGGGAFALRAEAFFFRATADTRATQDTQDTHNRQLAHDEPRAVSPAPRARKQARTSI